MISRFIHYILFNYDGYFLQHPNYLTRKIEYIIELNDNCEKARKYTNLMLTLF
jgi:hypothetical protein